MSAIEPYLLRSTPYFQDYLWGGRNLADQLGKRLPNQGIWAESWEWIDHSAHSTVISNGAFSGLNLGELSDKQPQWLLGSHVVSSGTTQLPLLLKFLDCQNDLSVQVHPDDDYASRMDPPDLGKTEAWYVVAAQPGAKLYAGLKQGVSASQLESAIEAGQCADCLHAFEPNAGDCVFIPAGTVHALGQGLLIAEIQQASNTTFRLFDWNRVSSDGKARPLHIAEALEVIDFEVGPRVAQLPESVEENRRRLVACDKFIFDELNGPCKVGGDHRFHLLAAPRGDVTICGPGWTEKLQLGESALLPGSCSSVEVAMTDNSCLLDMYLP